MYVAGLSAREELWKYNVPLSTASRQRTSCSNVALRALSGNLRGHSLSSPRLDLLSTTLSGNQTCILPKLQRLGITGHQHRPQLRQDKPRLHPANSPSDGLHTCRCTARTLLRAALECTFTEQCSYVMSHLRCCRSQQPDRRATCEDRVAGEGGATSSSERWRRVWEHLPASFFVSNVAFVLSSLPDATVATKKPSHNGTTIALNMTTFDVSATMATRAWG